MLMLFLLALFFMVVIFAIGVLCMSLSTDACPCCHALVPKAPKKKPRTHCPECGNPWQVRSVTCPS